MKSAFIRSGLIAAAAMSLAMAAGCESSAPPPPPPPAPPPPPPVSLSSGGVQAAADTRHEAGSKPMVPDGEGRVALAKQLGASPMAPATEDSAHLMQAAVTGTGLDLQSALQSPVGAALPPPLQNLAPLPPPPP